MRSHPLPFIRLGPGSMLKPDGEVTPTGPELAGLLNEGTELLYEGYFIYYDGESGHWRADREAGCQPEDDALTA